MKNKQTKGFDTIARILAFVGLGAVAIIAMLAVAPPEWDAAAQEVADTWFVPVVWLCAVLSPIAAAGLWIVARLQPQRQSRKRRRH